MKKIFLVFSLICLIALISTGCFGDSPPKKDFNYEIPNGTKIIDNETIPKKIKKSITSITIPDSVTEIGEYAFYDCKYAKTINIPKSVKTIGEYAFYKCKSLEQISIPNGITKIEKYTKYRIKYNKKNQ